MYLWDDEAEPDDEDDAEGERDCGEPAGQPHAQVQAAHPLGPGAATGKHINSQQARHILFWLKPVELCVAYRWDNNPREVV